MGLKPPEVPKYSGTPVEAVQVSNDPDEVAALVLWLMFTGWAFALHVEGKSAGDSGRKVSVVFGTDEGLTAEVGDWIIHRDDAIFQVVDEGTFANDFGLIS